MVKSTSIYRLADALPLAASMDDEESADLLEYKNQTKLLVRKLTHSSDPRCSIESGPYTFHYIIQQGVCYLTLCDKLYAKKLAFAYLSELEQEFQTRYGTEVGSVARPYAFVKFDSFIQKVKKQYKDTRTAKNLTKLNDDLGDVQKIMTKNIQDVLGRGDQLDRMKEMSSKLSDESKKYLKDSKKLRFLALYQKYGPPALVVSMVVLILYLRFFWW